MEFIYCRINNVYHSYIVLYIAAQKYITSGLTLGALK